MSTFSVGGAIQAVYNSIQQTNRVDDNKYNIYSINQVKMHSIIL